MKTNGKHVAIPPGLPPYLGDPDHWCTVAQAAVSFKRSQRTIHLWLSNGTFAEFGVKVYQDPTGVWHINVPPPRNGEQKIEISASTPASAY